MTEQYFWDLINESCLLAGYFKNNKTKYNYLVDELSKLEEKDIIDFETWLRKKVIEADHCNVSALVEILEGPYVSDDLYLYFRYELVMQGKQNFNDAFLKTDTLVDILDGDIETYGECFMTLADEAYENKFGEPENEDDYPRARAKISGEIERIQGESWTKETLPIRFPKLWNKFRR